MNLKIAFKAFLKALKEPEKADQFLNGKSANKAIEAADTSHLRLLSNLQESGRLIDFLKEDIDSYTDEQVGLAVRKIHQDCKKTLEELVTIRPLMTENEGATVKIPKGYNPSEIKIVGKVKGDAPYTGVLLHKGWKAHKRSLPKRIGEQAMDIVSPAEIEVR